MTHVHSEADDEPGNLSWLLVSGYVGVVAGFVSCGVDLVIEHED